MRIIFRSVFVAGLLGVVSMPLPAAAQSYVVGATKHFVVNDWALPLDGPAAPATPFVPPGIENDGTPPPPRKPWGHPDIEGIFTKKPRGVPLNSAWQNQPLPFTAEGLKAFNDVVNIVDPTSFCIMPGAPRVINSGGFPMQIVQTPTVVAILYEYMHNFRVIWIDGRRHPKEFLPSNFGHSVGRWEGDTLVVDTIGLAGQTWLDDHGNVKSDSLHLVEKYTRVSANQIAFELTHDDPKYYTRPWTASWLIPMGPPDMEVMEYACTDYNNALQTGGLQPGPIDGSSRNGGPIAVPPGRTPANTDPRTGQAIAPPPPPPAR